MTALQLLEPQSIRPLRRPEYDRLVSEGFFQDERIELLYGAIVRMAAKGPSHDGVVSRLTMLFAPGVAHRAVVRVQCAFAASDNSEPEPDLAVVPIDERDLEEHPARAMLIIEVADSSLKTDRGTKAKLYAESGVPEYWVIDLVNGLIHVYTDIVGGEYTRVTPYSPGDVLRAGAFPDLDVLVTRVVR